jgi:hypothetical protein
VAIPVLERLLSGQPTVNGATLAPGSSSVRPEPA